MVECRFKEIRFDGKETCETYSTENFKLKQEETGIIYGSSVIDVIEGYDNNGVPYSRYAYIETEEEDDISDETN